MPNHAPTVRDLRRKWKPHKERLNGLDQGHPTNVRFHRACSWIQQSELVSPDSDLDLKLLGQWIAFNSLYGQWDDNQQEPVGDTVCWRRFLDRMLTLDESQFLIDVLMDNKRLVMKIFDDEFLSRFFWQEPTDKRAKQSKKTKFDARTWYVQGDWTMIMDRLIERIYLLRCQLVHGAATYNSSLNRTATKHCSMMMDHLLRAFLLVWINHGADEDWGSMCYPPLRSKVAVR